MFCDGYRSIAYFEIRWNCETPQPWWTILSGPTLQTTAENMRWNCFPHYWSFVGESIGHRWIPLRKKKQWCNNKEIDSHQPHSFHRIMMTSSNGNIFRVTGHLCGEFTGHRWIPLIKASEAELWYFLWYSSEQTFGYTIDTPVIWDAIAPIMTSLSCFWHQDICSHHDDVDQSPCFRIPQRNGIYRLGYFLYTYVIQGYQQIDAMFTMNPNEVTALMGQYAHA